MSCEIDRNARFKIVYFYYSIGSVLLIVLGGRLRALTNYFAKFLSYFLS